MGIALAGHRNRNEMGCFVAGLNPKGAASSQNLKIGDEILEVNLWFSLRFNESEKEKQILKPFFYCPSSLR